MPEAGTKSTSIPFPRLTLETLPARVCLPDGHTTATGAVGLVVAGLGGAATWIPVSFSILSKAEASLSKWMSEIAYVEHVLYLLYRT